MKEQVLPKEIQRLIDESAIREIIYRYCRGMDRRNWAVVASAFHPDATDDHGVFKGEASKFIEFSKPRHESITMCMHHIANIMIAFKSDECALVESYCTGVHRYAPGSEQARKAITSSGSVQLDQAMELTMWVRYVDVVTKRNGEWRIADRRVVWEGMRADVVAPDGPQLGTGWVIAKRDTSDPVFEQMKALGIA